MKYSAYLLVCLFSLSSIARSDDGLVNGQLISAATSQDDAAQYVDHFVQNWIDAGKSDANGNIKPDQVNELARGLKPLGITNLIGCYKSLPTITHALSPTPKDRIKERVIAKAISLDATEDDIDAVASAVADQPLLMAVFVDHTEWDSNSKVTTFVTTTLGSVQDIYKKSNLAPRYLFELAARSPDADVQTALQTLIADVSQNPGTYKNAHLFPDLIVKLAQHPTSSLQNTLPDLIEIDAKRAELSPTDRYNGIGISDACLNTELYGGLAGLVISNPKLCADPKTKEALLKLNEKLGSNGAVVMSLLIPAATSGDKTALARIIAVYQAAPGKDSFAAKYLQSILSQPPGAVLTDVINHIETATYDPASCLWTVTATP